MSMSLTVLWAEVSHSKDKVYFVETDSVVRVMVFKLTFNLLICVVASKLSFLAFLRVFYSIWGFHNYYLMEFLHIQGIQKVNDNT